MTSYELGLRVPLIVRKPSKPRKPTIRSELVSTIDLLPSILDAAGAAPQANLAGRSLLPLLNGPVVQWRRYLFCEWNTSHTGSGLLLFFPQRTVRDERYKLILNVTAGPRNPSEEYYTSQILVETGPTQAEIDSAPEHVRRVYATWRTPPPMELYDLQNDPHEFVNLAERSDLAPVRQRIAAELQRWRQATDDPFLDSKKIEQLDAEHREQHELVSKQGRNAYRAWRYPQYLYGAK